MKKVCDFDERDGYRKAVMARVDWVWYPLSGPAVSGIPVKAGILTSQGGLSLSVMLMTRVLTGKGPFEALACGGRGTAIDGWWCHSLLLGYKFLLVCRLEQEDGWPSQAHLGPGLQLKICLCRID